MFQDFAPQTTTRKALNINLEERIYGTIAEIGAGQEVARHFFQAGKASGTIAKTISAYDMVFSDEIYGKEKSGRYVCESRLLKMLDHEFELLTKRLAQIRGTNTTFFALANTVTTSSISGANRCNGWMGIRFQREPMGQPNDIVLHVRMKDRLRLQQQEALGVLGVNLLFSAFFPPYSADDYVAALTENLGNERIEIDILKFSGPAFAHIDNRLMSLQLVAFGSTKAVTFEPNTGTVAHLPDVVFKKNVLVSRGTFRPITNANVDVLSSGKKLLMKDYGLEDKSVVVFAELTLHSLIQDGNLIPKDFLDRIDTLTLLGFHVLVSNYDLYYQMKSHLRRYTQGKLGIVMGSRHLEKIFSEESYRSLEGGILEGFGKLFDDNTRIYVYPFKQQNICYNTKSFFPKTTLTKLYQHLLENHKIVDILDCDETQASVHSSHVRQLMAEGNPDWERLVPSTVAHLVKTRKLFGLT